MWFIFDQFCKSVNRCGSLRVWRIFENQSLVLYPEKYGDTWICIIVLRIAKILFLAEHSSLCSFVSFFPSSFLFLSFCLSFFLSFCLEKKEKVSSHGYKLFSTLVVNIRILLLHMVLWELCDSVSYVF